MSRTRTFIGVLLIHLFVLSSKSCWGGWDWCLAILGGRFWGTTQVEAKPPSNTLVGAGAETLQRAGVDPAEAVEVAEELYKNAKNNIFLFRTALTHYAEFRITSNRQTALTQTLELMK